MRRRLKYGMTNVLRGAHFSISDPKRVGTTCNFFMASVVRTLGEPVTYEFRTPHTLWRDVPGKGSWKPRNSLDDKYFFLFFFNGKPRSFCSDIVTAPNIEKRKIPKIQRLAQGFVVNKSKLYQRSEKILFC